MTSARMKPLARSVWILPAASTAVGASLEVPAAHFGLSGSEEGDDADRVVGLADDPIAAQSCTPRSVMNAARSSGSS